MQQLPKRYRTHIESAAGWLRIPLGELWHYRDLSLLEDFGVQRGIYITPVV